MKTRKNKMPKAVASIFNQYPEKAQQQLLAIRELIFEVAAQSTEIGKLTETLKWGEPAYLTEQSRSGSTIRLGYKESDAEYVAMYFNCQTTLVEHMRWSFGQEFEFDGNRAVKIGIKSRLPKRAVRECIEMALTYHLNKKKMKA